MSLLKLLIILSFTVLICPSISMAESWSLSKYIQAYFQENEDLQVAEKNLVIRRHEYNSIDLWKSTLTLSDDETAYQVVEPLAEKTQSNYLSAGYAQQTPLGMSFSIAAKSSLYLDKFTNGSTNVDNKYSLSWTKSLRNNLWGQQESEQKKQKQLQITIQQANYKKQKIQTCKSAINSYMDTYIAQENQKILTEIMLYSQKALKVLQNGFNKKLISPAKYYSSKISLLSVKERQLKALVEQKLLVLKFYQSVGSAASDAELQPVSVAGEFKVPDFNYEQDLDYLIAKEEVLSSQSEVDLQKTSNEDDWSLSLSYDQTNGDQFNSGSYDNYTDNTTVVSLKIPIDVLNSGEKEILKAKLQKLKIAELKFKKATKASKVNHLKLSEQRIILMESLKLNEEKTNLLKKQVLYTLKKLNSGQIDVDDLVSYQDQYSKEALLSWELKKTTLINQVDLLGVFGNLHEVCRGQ